MSNALRLWSLGLSADAPLADPQFAGRLLELADDAGVDLLVLGEMRAPQARPAFDPLIVASWLAARARGVGLVAAVPALHCEPFHVARAMSALDFLSGGRSGWMPYSLGVDWARYGDAGRVAPENELPKAIDFVAATASLWDSWDGDALIIDAASGAYLHSDRVRRSDYRGAFHQVQGPLNAARPPQGHPLLVTSDADPLSVAVAADVRIVDSGVASGARRPETQVGTRLLLRAPVREAVGPGLDALLQRLANESLDGLHLQLADARADLDWLSTQAMPDWRVRGLLGSGSREATLRACCSVPVPLTASERARQGVRA